MLLLNLATIAILATSISALPSSSPSPSPAELAQRAPSDDPCATWCDPWFAITDAQAACQALVSDAGANLQLCSGCSIAHGGSIDLWAADYYGVNTDAAYSYKTDCQSCFNIDVPGINFGAVAQIYTDHINGNKTNAATAAASATLSQLSVTPNANSAAKSSPASASSSAAKSSITPLAQLEQLNSNKTSSTMASTHSAAGRLSTTSSATLIIALVAVFIGASF